MAQQRRWAVPVVFVVETDSAEDAVIKAARASGELRTRGTLPAGVEVGEPLGGGDPSGIYPADES